jgi:hypothetical protein
MSFFNHNELQKTLHEAGRQSGDGIFQSLEQICATVLQFYFDNPQKPVANIQQGMSISLKPTVVDNWLKTKEVVAVRRREIATGLASILGYTMTVAVVNCGTKTVVQQEHITVAFNTIWPLISNLQHAAPVQPKKSKPKPVAKVTSSNV